MIMASETEASCENDPNFAIICAFMEKFGGSCGLASIDFVELQQMLENNQEVSPELMNLHIKLLRKTKKNVTVERWERALINMCHTFSSKDAWEIERFGYKKTRLPIKLRALKELLEMQFDYNTKFKNEVNKMTADDLRSQPLGRDKLGRAYWFQTDNNYQIRIYKEDPDEETWKLIAKDREGLLALIAELTDGESKLSSDSAGNEDSNSLLEKPFIDTGQIENSDESKPKEDKKEVIEENKTSISKPTIDVEPEEKKSDSKEIPKKETSDSEKKSVINDENVAKPAEINSEVEKEEKKPEPEVKRPMLRIKSLSELMEKPKEPPKANFLPDLPELTITKKPKLDLPEITIVKKARVQQPPRFKGANVSPAIESPLMIIKGNGSGKSNKSGNPIVGEEIEEPVQFFSGRGSGRDCKAGNEEKVDDIIISDEIEEPVMFFFGEGSGRDCQTGNEKESPKMNDEKNKVENSNACTLPSSQMEAGELPGQVPTSHLSNFKLGTIIDSKTENKSFLSRDPNKKSRWDQKESSESEPERENKEETPSPKKMTFFFGPGSLNVKPNPVLNSSSSDVELENSKEGEEKKTPSETLPDTSNGSDNFSDNKVSENVTENSLNNIHNKSGKCEESSNVNNTEIESNCQQNDSGKEGDSKTNIEELVDVQEEKKVPSEHVSENDELGTKDSTPQDDLQKSPNNIDDEKIEVDDDAKATENVDRQVETCKQVSDEKDSEEKDEHEITTAETKEDDSDLLKTSKESDEVDASETISEKAGDSLGMNELKITEVEPEETKVEVSDHNDKTEVDLSEVCDKTEEDVQEPDESEVKKSEPPSETHEVEVDERPCETSEAKDSEPTTKKAEIEVLEHESEQTEVEVADEGKGDEQLSELSKDDEKTVEIESKQNKDVSELETNDNDVAEKKENETTKDIETKNIDEDATSTQSETVNKSIENTSKEKVSITDENEKDDCSVSDAVVNKQSEEKSSEIDSTETKIDEGNVPVEKSQELEVVERVEIEEKLMIKDQKDLVSDKKEESTKHDETISEKITDENIDTQDSEETPSKRKRVTRSRIQENDVGIKENFPKVIIKRLPVKKKEIQKESKTNTDSKKKQNDPEIETTESASPKAVVDVAATRSTRRTRASGPAVAVHVAPTPIQTKGKGKMKKPQTSKNDETGSTDSPIPLEAVIVDADSNSAAADNTETDPLAVSEEDVSKSNQNVTSITSFSFDYDPNSPTSAQSKRKLRKRGREIMENKLEAGETSGKRAKTKVKRTIDLNLRKSVEEKRIQEVGDVSSDENESVQLPVKKEVKGKAAKKVVAPKKKGGGASSVSDSDNASQKSDSTKKSALKNRRLLKNLGVTEEEYSAIAESPAPVRQSRRLAQIKIKEDATRRKIEEEDTSAKKKKKKIDDKDFKAGKRKRIEEEVKPAPSSPVIEKKRGRKKKKHNKISIGWNTSSDDSENSGKEEEEVSEYEYEEPHEEEPLQFKSDHEFSPESDLETDEQLPLKRARTARKEESDDEAEEEFQCQKCGKSDHPEWILLCDKCDNGWHCSCLRPALFVIPEGDWFCPTCQHETLLEKLHQKLVEFDKMLVKKEMEDRRKERLAYVGISLNNVLPAKEKKDKRREILSASEASSAGSGSGSASGSSSDSDEPIYQLRQRRQAHSYKFQDYDDLINSALQEEPPTPVEKTHTLGRGKDIATIVNAAKEEEERNAEKNGFEDLPPVVPKDASENKKKALSYRKKPKRLNNLEVNSDDEADDSDEDFKGSSSDESEDDFEEDSEDSFIGRKSSRAVRRSTRARTTRFDADFINDDDSDDAPTKKKKKRAFFDDSESELSDDWRGKKKKSTKGSLRKKSKKKKKSYDDSDLETYRKKKPKIKYGMDSDDDTKGRRTRGKKTSYLDTLGSDSEEEALKKKIKDKSEDDEYVADDVDEENDSEEDKESEEDSKANSETKRSDSEDEAPLLVKKLNIKNRRAIIESEDEEENDEKIKENKEEERNEKSLDKEKEESPKINRDEIHVQKLGKSINSQELEKRLVEKSPPIVVPMLNVEKLKACGITVTKVLKDKCEDHFNVENEKSPLKLMEIGTTVTPLSVTQVKVHKGPIFGNLTDKNLDEMKEDEAEKMMESEEYANKQLELAALHIQQAKKIKEGLNAASIMNEFKSFGRGEISVVSTKKLMDTSLKKVRTGRFFNVKPPHDTMLPSAPPPLMMNDDDDNDELSEPPGVTLPLFSEMGTKSMQNSSRSNSANRVPMSSTPPPMGSSRITQIPHHNAPHLPLPLGPSHHIGLNSRSTNVPVGANVPATPNTPVNVGPNGPPMTANSPAGQKSISVTPPISSSPDGTPKKRRGRGKGKKTLAAEAAAAAAAAGLSAPEPVAAKNPSNKPMATNIEIASPPQPFSQSQPTPSVITRMLQSSQGKGSFPVGRIRPKQFAMMTDTDSDGEAARSESHTESTHKDMPPHSVAPTALPPGHYGAPPGQYPPNYYQKDGPPPHGYHHQRPPPPPSMHPYPPHPAQPPPIDQPTMNQPPGNPPPMDPPMNMPESNPPPMGQYSGPPPAPKHPYDPMSHRPPYPNSNAGYNYDFNAPPPINAEEGLAPPPTANYENSAAYPEEYENPGSNLDPNVKNIEDEPSGEFGGLVSYFSSQHEDDLDT